MAYSRAVLLLLVLLAAPLDVSAARLERDAEGWTAQDVEIAHEGARLRAPRAEARDTDGCSPAVALGGPVELEAPGGRLAADSVTACARSGEATLVEGVGVRATACTCADPPWTLSASRASAIAGDGAWLTWPVLWAGSVPVAVAPAWYVPFGRRRSGFLLPELGWHAEDGPWGRVPLFLTLGQSADLTLTGGYRHGHGADAAGRLRWATTELDRGALGGRLVGTGWLAEGDGTALLGPLRFALDGIYAGDVGAWRTTRVRFSEQRDHLRGRLGVSVAGERLGLGARATTLQALAGPSGPAPLPETWLAWSAPWGPLAVDIDARALELPDASARLFDLGLGVGGAMWWGPLRFEPGAGLGTTVHGGDAGGGQRLATWAGLLVDAGIGRRFGAAWHELRLGVDGRWAELAALGPGEPTALIAEDRLGGLRDAGVVLSNRVRGGGFEGRLDVRGAHALGPDAGLLPVRSRLTIETSFVGLEGAAYAAEAGWGRARVGSLDGPRLLCGVGHLDLVAHSDWQRSYGPRRDVRPAGSGLRATTLEAGGALPVGPLAVRYAAWVDAVDPALLGQEGAVGWEGRCECWRAELRASHVRGRELPDLWLGVALGPR